MNFKKVVSKLHLWLGLSSGLVVFIIATTGCIYAFQEEIQDYTQSYRFIKNENKPFLLPSQIENIAEQALPGKHAHSVTYEKNGRAAQVSFYNKDPEYYYRVFINPYDGKVLKIKNMEEDFFRFILMGHFYLWLPPKIGQPVAATATLVFVLLLISGIIMWWPKNKNGRKQRFSIRWNSKWRRRNYDLHNVLGFYISSIALLLALTGLVWGFKWFAKTLYWTASGGKEMVSYYQVNSDTLYKASIPHSPADHVWRIMKNDHPEAASIEVHYPENSLEAIAANANPEEGTYWKRDYRYFDQHSLKEIPVKHMFGRLNQASGADKLLRMNYDIHVGAIAGLPGKIIAFLASLLTASLPITGFCIWWGRKKKSGKKNKAQLSFYKKNKPAIYETIG